MTSAKAEVYKNKGNDEYQKKDFNKAVHFYTEGLKLGCKDDELNAKLYNNRATVNFYMGKTSAYLFILSTDIATTVKCHDA